MARRETCPARTRGRPCPGRQTEPIASLSQLTHAARPTAPVVMTALAAPFAPGTRHRRHRRWVRCWVSRSTATTIMTLRPSKPALGRQLQGDRAPTAATLCCRPASVTTTTTWPRRSGTATTAAAATATAHRPSVTGAGDPSRLRRNLRRSSARDQGQLESLAGSSQKLAATLPRSCGATLLPRQHPTSTGSGIKGSCHGWGWDRRRRRRRHRTAVVPAAANIPPSGNRGPENPAKKPRSSGIQSCTLAHADVLEDLPARPSYIASDLAKCWITGRGPLHSQG